MITPFYFGSADRTLFGAYHPAATGGRRGAVLCYPWGQEYLRSHKAMCFLASLLSDRGFHVLRFDWYGSGDSAGECFEGGEPGSWMLDLQDAVTELKDMADIKTLAIVGLRMGAAVGAQLALRGSEVDRLVLWDPVVDGAEYIDALLGERGTNLSRAYPDHLAEDGGEIPEVLGFPLTPQMRKGIETLHPSLLRTGLPATLLVSSVPDPDRYSTVRNELELGGAEWSESRFDGPEPWVEEGNLGTSGMPVDAIRRITEWLS